MRRLRVPYAVYPQFGPRILGKTPHITPLLRFARDRLRAAAVTDIVSPGIRPIAAAEPGEIETLLDAAFGTDRRARTAYRLREGVAPIAALSFAAFADGKLVGTLQSWPIELRDAAGTTPLILVGPVAVHPDLQRHGIGHALMSALLNATEATPTPTMMLIGDAPYYGRFGFSASPDRHWTLPGPFEPHRLLVRESAEQP